MKTLGQFLEEAKATYCGRCGTRHVPPAQGGTCPALKEDARGDDECPKCERELSPDRHCSHCDHYVDKEGNIKESVDQIDEARGVTHATLLKKVSAMFDAHKNGNSDFATVNYGKNVHTGVSKHQVGSVKAHSLGYKAKPDGNAYTGREPYDSKKQYAKHPLRHEIPALIKKHGGQTSEHTGGGYIDTTDGYRHHFSQRAGTAYSVYEHSFHKKHVAEEAEQIDELSTEKLLQYMKKASDARGHRKLPLKKVDNRYAGVHKASAKLDKRFNEEAEQVDEAGLIVPRRDNLVSLKQHSFPDAEKKRKGLLKPIKTDYERQMDDAHSHIYKEDLDEGTIKVGTYMTKSGDALVLHRAEHDPKHHMLIRKSDGKVVAGHQGTSQEVHDKLTKETGLSGALHEAITTAKGVTTEAGTRHEMRVTKVLHNGEHVASIHTYRGRAGGWTSGVHTPDGKSASKKYGIDLMDTKKQMLSKIKNYHKGN